MGHVNSAPNGRQNVQKLRNKQTAKQLGQNIVALDILTGELLKVQSFVCLPVRVCPSNNSSIVIQCLKNEWKKQAGKKGTKEEREKRKKIKNIVLFASSHHSSLLSRSTDYFVHDLIKSFNLGKRISLIAYGRC